LPGATLWTCVTVGLVATDAWVALSGLTVTGATPAGRIAIVAACQDALFCENVPGFSDVAFRFRDATAAAVCEGVPDAADSWLPV
jgi:hypothetical protein